MGNSTEKNILFFQNSILPADGGVPRVTDIVSKELAARGYKSFFVYYDKGNIAYDNTVKLKVNMSQNYEEFEAAILQFVSDNNITHFVCQNTYFKPFIRTFSKLKALYPASQFITFLHAAPDYWQTYKRKGNSIKHRFIQNIAKNIAKRIVYPFYNPYISTTTALYNLSDKFVLLSDSFKPTFKKLYLRYKPSDKLFTIANPLTFSEEMLPHEVLEKEKTVLIVSRLDEGQKKISIALEVWKRITDAHKNFGWKLIIVGSGPDEAFYKRYVNRNKLTNVRFLGQQLNVLEYYKKASIFLMTSIWEGLPMSLLEAQQSGVVPVVFDNFSAVYDVIIDGENGYIIPNNDIKLFTAKLTRLLTCDELRIIMAQRAIERSARYHVGNIADGWEEALATNTVYAPAV